MQIKQFKANNMNEGLKIVKKEFGPEAVILSVRKIENDKAIFGFAKSKGIEITAATDSLSIENKQGNSQDMISKYYGHQTGQPEPQGLKRKSGFIQSLRQGTVNYIKKNNFPEKQNRFKNRKCKQLFNAYHQLLAQDVDEHIALKLIQDVNKYAFSARYLSKTGINTCIMQILDDAGIVANRVKLEKGKRKLVAVIGPTGVGKTSTIAKLSAAAKTRENKQDVALITLDEKRIGAIEQLKVYANILDTPVRIASNKKEFKKCVEKFQNYNLIFIDTPGMCHNNQQQMIEIKDTFDKVSDIEYHLVINAATNDKTLSHIIEQYKIFNISRLIFTKLDECITYGSILNQLYRSRIPVSYFTNGTNIPEDINAASIEKVTNMILGEKNMHRYLKGSPEELAQRIIRFEKKLYGDEEEMMINSFDNNKYTPAKALSIGE